MTTIDLGEIVDTDAAPPTPLNVPRIRRAILAAVTALGLGAIGGSARPTPPAVRPVWSTDLSAGDEARFSADTAYLSRVRGGRLEITGYDLATGRPAWTTPIDDPGPATLTPVGGVVVLGVGYREITHEVPGGATVATFHQSTVALDGATGAELWRAAGDPGVHGPGEVLLEGVDQSGRTDRLTLVRARDGKPEWSHAVPGIRSWVATERDGHPAEVVTVGGDNRVTRYRYADGSVIRRGTLPADFEDINTVGGYLTDTRTYAGSTARITTTLYRTDDATPLWTRVTTDRGLTACGPILCLANRDGVEGLDPATGRTLWRRTGSFTPRPAPGGQLLLYGTPEGLSTPADADFGRVESGPQYVVVDAATGRPKRAPGRGWVVQQPDPADSALVYWPPVTHPGRTSITRVALATGRPTLLGTTDAVVGEDCTDLGHYLACPELGRLTVMAVG